jgi:hypothetical protein
MVPLAESLEDEPTNPVRRPNLRGIPRPLGTSSQERDELAALAGSELGRTAWARLTPQGWLALLPRLRQPLADGSATDAKLPCDVCLWDPLAMKGKGLKASVFELRSVSSLGHAGRLSRRTRLVK